MATKISQLPSAVSINDSDALAFVQAGATKKATAGTFKAYFRSYTASVPDSPTAAGSVGQYSGDADYVYLCIASDTWIRVAADDTWT